MYCTQLNHCKFFEGRTQQPGHQNITGSRNSIILRSKGHRPLNTCSMDIVTHEDKTFNTVNYADKTITKQEFLDCSFINCNFSKANISQSDFMDCVFRSCNLSLAVMENTGLKNCAFTDCKLIGIDFSKCSNFLFAVNITDSPLDYSSFFQKKLKKTMFKNCSIKDADFTEADLSLAMFSECDLMNTVFVQCNLEKADFSTAVNYVFDPEQNRMNKAKFSFPAVAGLLAKYNISLE